MWNKPLTHREWIFILLLEGLLFIVGGFIQTSLTAVEYTNYAATFVSMILAVIAIVYAYFQGYTQKSDSSMLSSQITELGSVLSSVTKSAKNVSNSAQFLRDVTTKLDDHFELLKTSREDISDLKKMVLQSATKDSAVNNSIIALTEEQAFRFVESLRFGGYVVLNGIFRTRDAKMPESERIEKYIMPFGLGLNENTWIGMMYGTIGALDSAGLVEVEDDWSQFTFDPKYIPAIKRALTEEGESQHYRDYFSEFSKAFPELANY